MWFGQQVLDTIDYMQCFTNIADIGGFYSHLPEEGGTRLSTRIPQLATAATSMACAPKLPNAFLGQVLTRLAEQRGGE